MRRYLISNNDMPSFAFLGHYGIKDMRWYHRRWQNEDGSYTEAGRIRYGIGQKRTLKNNVAKRKTAEKLIKYSNAAAKQNKKVDKLVGKGNWKKASDKAEAIKEKQYEKAHELISDNEKLHAAIDAYDLADDAYTKAINDFLSDKKKYAEVVDAQIEEDRKHGFYGGTEENFRDYYNSAEGSQVIEERYELTNDHMRLLNKERREAETAFENAAKDLYNEALGVYGGFPVNRKDPLTKKAYALAEDLAQKEVWNTLWRNHDRADKFLDEQNAEEEFYKLPADEQNKYLTKAAEKQYAKDVESGLVDKVNKSRARMKMDPITKDDYVWDFIDGDGPQREFTGVKEYTEDKKNSGKNQSKPEYIEKVEKNGDTRYFYDKSELKAYKDGKSGASDKDMEAAYQKMRNSAKTDEEKDTNVSRWERARDKDLWDIDFMEAVQNSVILDKGDTKSLLTEYAHYLEDPNNYWDKYGSKLKEM